MDLIAIGLIVWSRLLMRRPDAPRLLRWVAPALVLGFLVSLVGTGLGLTWAFRAVETVPAARMKAGREHRVPLCADAMFFPSVSTNMDHVLYRLVFPLLGTFLGRCRDGWGRCFRHLRNREGCR